MKAGKKDNVILVFEPACDAHWMKDVVQFPNALSQHLFNRKAILITRPNHKQIELAKHIGLEFFGKALTENYEHFESVNFSKIITQSQWYLKACKKAADFGSILILYPFYGDAFKGSKYFKIKRWLQFRKAFVIIKSDGTLHRMSTRKASIRQRINDKLKYFFIDRIICENSQVYKDMQVNNSHLLSKIVFLPNCPLDMYHSGKNTPYAERPDIISFIGRVDDNDKGADILLEAWIKVALQIPGWHLKIIGPCSAKLKREWELRLADTKLLDTVIWTGAKHPDELIFHYRTSKTVICSSRKESGPIILSESILCGCSFIGTAVGEIPDVLKDLPGLVKDENTLEKQILFFAQHPEIAGKQAESLFERLKERKWSIQVKKLIEA